MEERDRLFTACDEEVETARDVFDRDVTCR